MNNKILHKSSCAMWPITCIIEAQKGVDYMVVNKSSGNYSVLDAGTMLAFNSSSNVELEIVMDSDFSFKLQLLFESNDSKQHDLKSSVNGDTVTLTCTNFDNPLGTGTKTPIELGLYQGKKIYFNFWVHSLGSKTARKVSYTLYIEK